MNHKLKDASKLLKSKAYILITDKDGVMAGDFRGISAMMKLNTLSAMKVNLEDTVTKLTLDLKPHKKKKATKAKPKAKEANSAGNKSRRSKSRSNK